jgi:hypothetical protein
MNNYHRLHGEIDMVEQGEVTSLVYVYSKDRELKVKNTDLCTREQYLEVFNAQAEVDYAKEVAEKEEATRIANSNTLWGSNAKYSTQAEYQRSCMGKKWN